MPLAFSRVVGVIENVALYVYVCSLERLDEHFRPVGIFPVVLLLKSSVGSSIVL